MNVSEKTPILIDGKVIGKCHRVRLSEEFSEGGTVYQYHVEGFEKPTLNENQKLALEVLKIEYEDRGNCAAAIYWALEDDSLPKLEKKEFAQVLQAFSQWALEQEEE